MKNMKTFIIKLWNNLKTKATTIPKIYFKKFHKVLKYDKIMKIMNESQDLKLTRNEN